jgi:hypothetical protein
MSSPRMARYYMACNGDSKRAMTLYRLNLRLSQELFTIISCFEVALRNAIDRYYQIVLGSNWLRDAAVAGGIFDTPHCRTAANTINQIVVRISNCYSHNKVISELGFGFWRYLFSPHQYRAGGQSLIGIFPALPTSTPSFQYNANFIFNQLANVNKIRNRIAHHEAICFRPAQPIKDTSYVRQNYFFIIILFKWMNISEDGLLYGIDHIQNNCEKIDAL